MTEAPPVREAGYADDAKREREAQLKEAERVGNTR